MARIFDLLIVAGIAILAIRMYAAGLYRRYRVFFFYLIFSTLHLAVLASVKPTSDAYQKIWVFTEPLDWFFYVLVVLEIYALVLEGYKGLSTAGRWALIVAVLIALAASGLSLIAPSQHIQSLLMTYYYVAERAVYFSLMVFLLSILLLLMQYPIVLNRNIIVHSMVFSIYFLGNSVFYLLLSMRLGSTPMVGYALSCITLAAVGAWLVWLNPAGEERKLSLRPSWMPGQEEQLVAQLNQLNAALLRATRK